MHRRDFFVGLTAVIGAHVAQASPSAAQRFGAPERNTFMQRFRQGTARRERMAGGGGRPGLLRRRRMMQRRRPGGMGGQPGFMMRRRMMMRRRRMMMRQAGPMRRGGP